MVWWAGRSGSAEAAATWPALCFPRSLREAEPPELSLPTACLLLSRGKFVKISHHSSKQSPCSFSCHYSFDSSKTLQLRAWPCGYEVVLAPRTV